MGPPVRIAWCKILFGANGGRFTSWGMPIFSNETFDEDDGYVEQMPIRGKCNRAYDCIECSPLNEWLKVVIADGWGHGWECNECLKKTEKTDKADGLRRQIQGIYQAGRKRAPPEDNWNFDEDYPVLEGCTRCGWETSFLQLVLRKPR